MHSSPSVTAIVPIYKAEAYIRRCLDSLAAQTLKSIEVLLINDGSPDRSGEICEEYAKRFPQFRVIHKANEGLNATLELGIREAKGEYTIQLDPDDWVEPEMYEQMYLKAQQDNADMVICDINIIKRKGTAHSSQQPSSLRSDVVLAEIFTTLHGSCCNKLVRNSLYAQHGVHHPKGFTQCEDLYVTSSLLRHDLRVSYIPRAFYHYDQTINSNSIIKHYGRETLEQDLRMFQAFATLAESFGSARSVCLERMAQLVVSRAMKSGALSSRDFAKHFGPMAPHILSNPRLKPLRKLKYVAACRGYYFLMRPFILLGRGVRKLIGK